MQTMSYVIPIIGMIICFIAIFHKRCDTQSRSNAFLIHFGLVIWLVSLWGAFEVFLPPWLAIIVQIALLSINGIIINNCVIHDMKQHYSLPQFDRRQKS